MEPPGWLTAGVPGPALCTAMRTAPPAAPVPVFPGYAHGMSPTLGAFKAVLGVQTDPGEGLSLSRWAGTHAELEGWPRASACLRVTSEPQAEVPCGHRPPVLCRDWEGRRVRPPASSRV